MNRWVGRSALSLLVAGLVAFASGMTAHSAPTPDRIDEVPGRTALSFMHTPSGTRIGTANQGEARPGLSIVKLYVAEYLLRHGDGSPEDLALGQRMIRDSDDNAASQAYAKYPQSVDVIAAEYRLTSTRGSDVERCRYSVARRIPRTAAISVFGAPASIICRMWRAFAASIALG
ncbi:hypothetical protein MPY17_00815 [Rhodococcus opacus]|nr:hypothetical protein MPY17_00815 [Rhodococcus opacus]